MTVIDLATQTHGATSLTLDAPARPSIRPAGLEAAPGIAAAKRALDIVVSALALLVLAPVLLIVAIAVRRSDGGSALFRQDRVGHDGKQFKIIKFRSMHPNAEAILHADEALYARYVENGYKLDASEDPRIGKLGKFIRSTSIDELPQLWNVLKGDMTLVGPRPIRAVEMDEYSSRGAAMAYLHCVPGMTGLWQCSGRSNVDYDGRVEMDMAYLADNSFVGDIKIIAKTAITVLKREGAH